MRRTPSPENVLRRQQADHQECFPFKIEKEAGLDQHAVFAEQIQHPFLFALDARRFEDGIPAAFG